MIRLADLMADGCPTLTEAAYRMRLTVAEAMLLWRQICAGLGAQAR